MTVMMMLSPVMQPLEDREQAVCVMPSMYSVPTGIKLPNRHELRTVNFELCSSFAAWPMSGSASVL